MSRKYLFFIALFLTACSGNSDLDKQQRILDDIEKNVTVTFTDLGSVKTDQDGTWKDYKFKVANEFRKSVWILRIKPSILPDAAKVGNPEAYCFMTQVKGQMWADTGEAMIGSPHDYIEIPTGQNVEFAARIRTNAPDMRGEQIRGYVTVYCDPTDINGRHIISAPLPFNP